MLCSRRPNLREYVLRFLSDIATEVFMRVYFRKSGGFAAMFVGFILDTDEKPGPEAEELKSLVQSSGIMSKRDMRMEKARDVYLYTWQITENGKDHSVTIDQLSMPEEVKPLLDFCMARAKNMLPD